MSVFTVESAAKCGEREGLGRLELVGSLHKVVGGGPVGGWALTLTGWFCGADMWWVARCCSRGAE